MWRSRYRYWGVAALLLLPWEASALTERGVSLDGLRGTITLPEGNQLSPAVLILPGSGPVDRDGNIPGMPNNSLRLLAKGLADRGIASLRIDKRGIGESRSAAPGEEALRFDTYVEDAVRWIGFLRSQDGVKSVAVLGHSEGALVATLAAQRADVSALVLVAGPGTPFAELLERQLKAAGVPDTLRETSRAIAAKLRRGERVETVPPELVALYRPSVQPYLISLLTLDPVAELARTRCRVLIVQGTTDIQIETADAERLAKARPDARVAIIEGMNHVLKDAPPDRAPNIGTYAEPGRPLSPRLVPAIADFLSGR
ncbi:lysophospholipase [Rhodomicrobium sp. Az07]|uniref:alpha/beta hydrolase n=1 Tax=Rhodomicrobium sp. Az07 TaxID=2839034 RepID=UPI001BECF8A4|nr:alpha/beta fold hydrolase [Rhodomicrobium sp. Az07]MBT3069394.1 lysophospholipase [Rhodomicrobium sp. Az07]